MKIPPELITFITAMTPLLDIKLAIPLGIKLGLSPISAIFFASAGNILPAAIFLFFLDRITAWSCKKSKLINNFLEKIFAKTHKKHSKNFEIYGPLFIILFIGIPIPGSGSISGAILAFLFEIEYWKAVNLIIFGTLVGAILVTAGFTSIVGLIHLIF